MPAYRIIKRLVGEAVFLPEQCRANRSMEKEGKVPVHVGHGHAQFGRHLEKVVPGNSAAYIVGQGAKLGAVWVDTMASGKFLSDVAYAVDVGLQAVG